MWHLRRPGDRQPIFRLAPHRRAPTPPETHNGNPPLTLSGKSQEATDVARAALEALPHFPGEDRGGRNVAFATAQGPSTYFPPRAAQARPHTP